MWDILEVTHEGTTEVKRARKYALIQEYELFRMQQGESIADVQKRFTHIVNHLIGLGKQFDNWTEVGSPRLLQFQRAKI